MEHIIILAESEAVSAKPKKAVGLKRQPENDCVQSLKGSD